MCDYLYNYNYTFKLFSSKGIRASNHIADKYRYISSDIRILPLGERVSFADTFPITSRSRLPNTITNASRVRERAHAAAAAANGIDSLGFFVRDPIKETSEIFQLTCILAPRPHNEVGRFNFLNIHGTPCPSGERNHAPREREGETANHKYSISRLAATSNERRIWDISDESCLSTGVYSYQM